MMITVAARSEAWTVFARSNTGIMGSNPTWGTDVCVHLFCVCVALCVGSGPDMGWSPVQGALPIVYKETEESGQGPKGCWSLERGREMENNGVWFLYYIKSDGIK
jgi:hypothetical protein